MKIRESAENYLETILILQQKTGAVRSIDIATEMGFSKPSVSIAMKNLRLNGYIQIEDSGLISLLPEGQRIAESIYERHLVIKAGLMALGVPEAIAAEDACRVEHDLSPESFDAIKNHFHSTL